MMSDKARAWSERLAAWRASGLSAAAFCRTRELSYMQFMYWKRRLRPDEIAAGRALVPIQVQETAISDRELSLTLRTGALTVRVEAVAIPDAVALIRGLAC